MENNIDYKIPMEQAPQGAMVNANIPFKIDQSIPSQVKPFAPIDVAGAELKAYKMADDIETHKDNQAKRVQDQINREDAVRDRNLIKQYEETIGHRLVDPKDINKAMETLDLSQAGRERLLTYADGRIKTGAQIEDLLSKADERTRKQLTSHVEDIQRTLQPAVQNYKNALKAMPEPDARQLYQKSVEAALGSLAQMRNPQDPSKPVFQPQELEKFRKMEPTDLEHETSQAKWFLDIDKEVAQTAATKALARSREGSPGSRYNTAMEVLAAPDKHTLIEIQEARKTLDEIHAGKKGAITEDDWRKLPPEKQKAIDTAAWNLIITGHQPPARGGLYEQTMAYTNAIAAENNMTVQELLNAAGDVKSRMQAKKSFEQRVLNISRAENVLASELPVLQENMKKVDLSKYPDLSHIQLAILRKRGDPNVTKMDQSAAAVFNEFEGIMTGNVGGALNVSDVEKAKKDYYSIQTPQQLQAWIDNAHNMIKRAKEANDKTRTEWMEGVKGVIGSKSPLKASNTPTPEGFPKQPAGGDEAKAIIKAEYEGAKKEGKQDEVDKYEKEYPWLKQGESEPKTVSSEEASKAKKFADKAALITAANSGQVKQGDLVEVGGKLMRVKFK